MGELMGGRSSNGYVSKNRTLNNLIKHGLFCYLLMSVVTFPEPQYPASIRYTNALLAFGDLGPSLSSLSMAPLANAALIASAGNTHRRTNGLSRWTLVYL
jgi:hypothetical protein